MEIREYTIAGLREALALNTLWNTETVPITRIRAISQINNPRALEDDVVLLVACEGEKVAGYIGVLPDLLHIEGEVHRGGWITCWWVDSQYQGKGVGRTLESRAIELYDDNIIHINLSDAAIRVVESRDDTLLFKKSEGECYVVRSHCASYARKHMGRLGKLSPLIKIFDSAINALQNFRLLLWKKKQRLYETCRFEFISCIDDEIEKFIEEHQDNELSRRGMNELNWILQYPWLVPSPVNDEIGRKYYFMSSAKRHFYLNVKVLGDEGQMIGLLMLKVRNNHLRIPYAYFDDADAREIMRVVCLFLVEMNMELFTIHNKQLRKAFSQAGFPAMYIRKAALPSYISKKFISLDATKYVLQDGDGDLAFY
jgi:GNAT superfamily N-acetyltransferase